MRITRSREVTSAADVIAVTDRCAELCQRLQMLSSSDSSVRVVVQRLHEDGAHSANYLLVLYPGPNKAPFHSEKFSSREEVIQRLKAGIVGLDESQLSKPVPTAQIVFAETVRLSDAQLHVLAFGRIEQH